jgi:hypothetical protein
LAFATDCDAAELEAVEPLPEEVLEHAVIESAASTDAAPPTALRENRRDIRIAAVPPLPITTDVPGAQVLGTLHCGLFCGRGVQALVYNASTTL